METFEQRLASVGALADHLRRKMYLFIREQRRPVGRDEAARAVGISRKLAAFHLDKLVEKGLLTHRYARLTGRTGPGAGRPAKVYEPSDKEISVSIPFRSYDVIGDILLEALESSRRATSPRLAAQEAAHHRGLDVGKNLRQDRARRRLTTKAAVRIAREILSERGYEPYTDESGGLRLHNCPFHDLAQRSPGSVCDINQAFIEGILEGLGVDSLDAVLDRRPGECCVHLRPTEAVA